MFFLGIIVGRGTSPVTFDTKEFSKKLEKIANVPIQKKEVSKKVDLKFYEDLDHPLAQERVTAKNSPSANISVKEPVKEPAKEPVKEIKKEPVKEPEKKFKKESVKEPEKEVKKEPVKESVKKLTKDVAKESEKLPVKEPVKEAVQDIGEAKTEVEKKIFNEGLTKGSYTIQIAAYKSFQDAVSEMAALEEKGFSTYRVRGEKDGVTWYRVRIGPFDTYDAAKEFKTRLDKTKIDAMIMKRETDEDIKE